MPTLTYRDALNQGAFPKDDPNFQGQKAGVKPRAIGQLVTNPSTGQVYGTDVEVLPITRRRAGGNRIRIRTPKVRGCIDFALETQGLLV